MKILRYLNVLAVVSLVGSAVYAYSISYQTMFYGAQIDKTKDEIQHQRDDIAMLRAEWAHLTRPQRLQALANQYLDLQPLSINQIVSGVDQLPDRAPRSDAIGRELQTLGLAAPTATPGQGSSGGAATPQR
jgi:cell division protein FtsL